ncbi:MAG TPA: cobyrinate a,c-diamide synthase [Methylomusa anaerophila]|uniref:Cobyrinate a,c-diamide synthase n=1 Tax=Methylomusa anaerophila TaxID=1930071 RepID=A0A348AQD9_9FIRM|nr:cobyrinate a,c-diamide synthase [Methylomusa anaerophila]BBB93287.1 cobyrinic acid A,C-diamide synthase [Methylomusa anaerophila]HML86882.1 cobyrinate a,c-diamide synthase [Methylomusa anaerophila]
MAQITIPRIIIAGTHSGVGKTTIVTGLLAALRRRGFAVQSYKVGPDYIDPGYHRLASGKCAHNLDTWLVPPEMIAGIFAKTAVNNDLAIVEGVMGLYDGGRSGVSSTAAIAKLLRAPVVLVVDAKSMGESVAATVLGYKMYDSEVNLAGVIVNRLGSETHKTLVCEALERIQIPILGCVFRNTNLSAPERHLGLTPVTEHDAQAIVAEMAGQIAGEVNIEQLIELAQAAPVLEIGETVKLAAEPEHVRIGVAQDDVFTFYYPASLDVLENYGAELVPFSPLKDDRLPEVDGLILGGGFPEMFVEQLAANSAMRQAIQTVISDGMPVYAECGGLMYLSRQIADFSGNLHDMVGAIPAVCRMQSQLETVGYVEVTTLQDNVLGKKGDTLRGHEFHFSRMIPDIPEELFPWAFQFCKMRTGAVYRGGYAKRNVLASYLHMHFAGNEQAAHQFTKMCRQYRITENKKTEPQRR